MEGEQKQKQFDVERMLTCKEVCQLMGFSRTTFVKLANEGKIKSVRIGRSIRVFTPDLQAYIDSLRGDIKRW